MDAPVTREYPLETRVGRSWYWAAAGLILLLFVVAASLGAFRSWLGVPSVNAPPDTAPVVLPKHLEIDNPNTAGPVPPADRR